MSLEAPLFNTRLKISESTVKREREKGGGEGGIPEGSLVLCHFTRDIITTTKLIAETLSITININLHSLTGIKESIPVEHETTDTTKGFSGEELHLGVWLLGIDEASWVNLDAFDVLEVGADRLGHPDTVTGAVFTYYIMRGEEEKEDAPLVVGRCPISGRTFMRMESGVKSAP